MVREHIKHISSGYFYRPETLRSRVRIERRMERRQTKIHSRGGRRRVETNDSSFRRRPRGSKGARGKLPQSKAMEIAWRGRSQRVKNLVKLKLLKVQSLALFLCLIRLQSIPDAFTFYLIVITWRRPERFTTQMSSKKST